MGKRSLQLDAQGKLVCLGCAGQSLAKQGQISSRVILARGLIGAGIGTMFLGGKFADVLAGPYSGLLLAAFIVFGAGLLLVALILEVGLAKHGQDALEEHFGEALAHHLLPRWWRRR